VELAAYLGTVTATVTLALGAMGVVASVLGRRIDDLGTRIDDLGSRLEAMGARLEAMGARLNSRMDRMEAQNSAIIEAVSNLGQRVAHLETRGS
jgi:flagellar capping protein FliD